MNLAKQVFDSMEKSADYITNSKKAQKKFSQVVCTKDVPYTDDMAMDVYFLPREEKHPVIFEIHGGGFSGGDKKYRRCMCSHLAHETGAVVFNVNYGMGGKYVCPVPMQQLADAVNWIADHAEQFNLDLSKFVVMGESAGAYYATFLAVLQESDYLQALYNRKLKVKITAAFLNCGVYDMKLALKTTLPMKSKICKNLTGKNLKEAQKDIWFESLTLTTFMTEKFPPTLLVYAQKDLFVPKQGQMMQQKLADLGVPFKCIASKSVFDNHGFSMWRRDKMSQLVNLELCAFLKNHFSS